MRIKDGFRLRDVMGQATVIGEGVGQINFNKLITLNSTAAWIWEQVAGKDFDSEMVADLLVDEYGIDRELAVNDAVSITEKWVELGVVE